MIKISNNRSFLSIQSFIPLQKKRDNGKKKKLSKYSFI